MSRTRTAVTGGLSPTSTRVATVIPTEGKVAPSTVATIEGSFPSGGGSAVVEEESPTSGGGFKRPRQAVTAAWTVRQTADPESSGVSAGGRETAVLFQAARVTPAL